MQFTPVGKNFYGSQYTMLQNVYINYGPLNSFTFEVPIDGDEQVLYGLSIKWINPLTGVKRLRLQYNGTQLTGVNMWRSARNLSNNTNEDAAQTQWYIAELQSGVANCTFQGVAYFDGHRNGYARYLIVEGFQYDASASLGDIVRGVYRQARWNDNTTQITGISIIPEDGSACIGNGSEFILYATY